MIISKSPLGLTNEDEKCVSTFIVKADVHRTDNSDVEPVMKPVLNKRLSNKKCPKSELDLSTVDDIHIVASENLFSPQTIKQDKQKREKPRWSLRIKLHSSEDNDFLNGSIYIIKLYKVTLHMYSISHLHDVKHTQSLPIFIG